MVVGNSVKILAQGYTSKINSFKDIDFDISFLEKKSEEQRENEFHLEQETFNSAELYNKSLRDMSGTLPCYSFLDVKSTFSTTTFITYKFSEIRSVSEYLLKVLSVIDSVLTGFIQVRKSSMLSLTSEQHVSEAMREFERSKHVIHGLMSLFSDVLCTASDLEYDKNNIRIDKIIYEVKEFLRLSVAVRYIPDEAVPDINSIFPAVTLFRASEIPCSGYINDLSLLYTDFRRIEERLMQVLTFFVKGLLNQFSFYVTPESFLNNPMGRTIFVVPMSLYKQFGFQNSGLYKMECPQYEGFSLDYIIRKQSSFLNELKTIFGDIYEQSEKLLFESHGITNEFCICDFINMYLKKHPSERFDRIQTFVKSPIVFEKLTEVLLKNYSDMIMEAKSGNNPWIPKYHSTDKHRDKDLVYFLLRLYDLNPCGHKRFPQSELLRLFNIFSYSNQPVKCMNAHVRKYYEGKYKVSKNYEKNFGVILKR